MVAKPVATASFLNTDHWKFPSWSSGFSIRVTEGQQPGGQEFVMQWG
jgi:hypothetical protein